MGAALRRLKRTPVFTCFAVITLAVGIGITTAFSAVLEGLVSPRLAVPDTSTLVTVAALSPLGRMGPVQMSWPDVADLTAQSSTFAHGAAYAGFSAALIGGGASNPADVVAVSGDYFKVLAVNTAFGRWIQPADDQPAAMPVVVLSYSVWRSQFSGDPSVVGTSVTLAGQLAQVIGVMPKGFHGVGATFGRPSAWVPLSFTARFQDGWLALVERSRRSTRAFGLIARIAPDASPAFVSTEIAGIGRNLDATVPLTTKRIWQVLSFEELSRLANSQGPLRVLFALPFAVLLAACANLANLIASRGSVRRYELALRTSLGASRRRLIIEELAEPTILATCGGLLSLVVSRAALAWAASSLQAPLAASMGGVPMEWDLGPATWAIAGAATVVAILVCGLLPAIRLTSTRLHFAMAADNTIAKPGWRWRRNLIALQVFASVGLCLLTLVARAYVREHLLPEVASPMHLEQLAVAQTSFELQRYSAATGQRAVRDLVAETRLTFGVGNAAIASEPPFAHPFWAPFPDVNIVVDGERDALMYAVAGDYFRALSYRTITGRIFDDRDTEAATPVVIVSDRLARDVFGSTNAVGRQFRWRQSRLAQDVDPVGSATVVGVVAGWQDDKRVSFAPFEQRYQRVATVIARAPAGGAAALVEPIRAAIRRADPSLAVILSGPADVVAGGPRVLAAFVMTTVGILSGIVLLLSMSGLYGVLSQIVTQRRREMGLRSALGAGWRHLVWLVMRDGLAPVLEGCAIGLGVAAVVRQLLLSTFNDDLSAMTVQMIFTVVLPLLLLAVVTCYLPARRAAATDPNVVLRDQ